jgi:hypothetical protein
VEEALGGRDAETVQGPGAAGVDVGIEGRTDFVRLERSNLRERVGDEVDGELDGRDGDVAGN